MNSAALMTYCTCPDEGVAGTIAEALVDKRLAACVNILPGVQSVYHWQGKIQCDPEVLLVIKTTEAAFPQLEQAIKTLHPYELPEIVAVTITAASTDYLQWIHDSVG